MLINPRRGKGIQKDVVANGEKILSPIVSGEARIDREENDNGGTTSCGRFVYTLHSHLLTRGRLVL